jgi:hypothetical protein
MWGMCYFSLQFLVAALHCFVFSFVAANGSLCQTALFHLLVIKVEYFL